MAPREEIKVLDSIPFIRKQSGQKVARTIIVSIEDANVWKDEATIVIENPELTFGRASIPLDTWREVKEKIDRLIYRYEELKNC